MRTYSPFSANRRRLVLALLALALIGLSPLGLDEAAAGRTGAANDNDGNG
jgi:hypothetical protein